MENVKDLLQVGYLVEFENGERALYMPYKNQVDKEPEFVFDFFKEGACLKLDCYDDNLRYNCATWDGKSSKIYDVKRIYGFSRFPFSTFEKYISWRTLIWERKKYPKFNIGDKVFVKDTLYSSQLKNNLEKTANKPISQIDILWEVIKGEEAEVIGYKDYNFILRFFSKEISLIDVLLEGIEFSPNDLELIE